MPPEAGLLSYPARYIQFALRSRRGCHLGTQCREHAIHSCFTTYMILRGRLPAHFHMGDDMILNRQTTFPVFAILSLATALATITLTTTPVSAAGAQYCIARSGVNGASSYVGNCIYSDYQQCLQVAADNRGNCVQNIEYRPGIATEPAARRARRTR